MTTFADPAGTTRLTPPAEVLRGPTHADNYRVKVGRYGDRWYTDPLPADAAIPATPDDEAYPSVSIIKKASGADWSYVALKRAAHADDLATIAKGGYYERYEKLKVVNSLGLSVASRRGTNVHTWAECLAYGIPPTLTHADEGSEFFGTVDRIWSDLRPRLVAAELVCIHRTLNMVGYGGTSDGIFEIDGKRYMVDWKSRGADSEHGAYPEEAAQLGAYAGAEYIIVDDDDPANPHGAKRAAMPELDGGLIISIKPDSYEVYPVNLTLGFDHFINLHGWWVARRNERKPVGRKWAPRRTVAETTAAEPLTTEAMAEQIMDEATGEARKAALYARHDKMTAEQQADFSVRVGMIEGSDLDAVEALMDDIEHPKSLIEIARERMARDKEREEGRAELRAGIREALNEPEPEPEPVEVDADTRLSIEGGAPDEGDVNEFTVRWELGMSDHGREWVGAVVNAASMADVDFRLSTLRSQRRADIYCALTEWTTVEGAERDYGRNDELFRDALRTVVARTDDDMTTAPLGLLVGSLMTGEAAALRVLVTEIAAGRARWLDGDATSAPRWALIQDTTTTSES